MFVQFGPSWRLRIPIKQLDMPCWTLKNRAHEWTKEGREFLEAFMRWNHSAGVRAIGPDAVQVGELVSPYIQWLWQQYLVAMVVVVKLLLGYGRRVDEADRNRAEE